MELQLAGYFPKTIAIPAGYSLPDDIREICTASLCTNAPGDWPNHWPKEGMDKWRHNELGFYNTRADAQAILPAHAEAFVLFAYRMLPVRFAKEGVAPIDLPRLLIEPLDETFISIGFDAVSKSSSSFFECSPLSCNYLAREIPVNRYYLAETLADAVALAKRFAIEEPEPGVLEVLRQHVPAQAPEC